MESAAASESESSILLDNNRNTDRSDTAVVVAVVKETEEQQLEAVVVVVRWYTVTETVDTYRTTDEWQFGNNTKVEGQFGNLEQDVHVKQVSTGSYHEDDLKDDGDQKL